jgi:hypothetical protein
MTESALMKNIMLAAAKHDARLFRNNIGTLKNNRGEFVTFGVANPGGSDLIGWRSIIITQDMIGQRIAQFLAVECKGSKGKLTEQQYNFIHMVKISGGSAHKIWPEDDISLVFK